MSTNDRADASTGSLAELFHLVGRLVPETQEVIAARPDMTVAEAIEIMYKHNFSQLPVVAGPTVLGVFSFRSLAQGLLRMGRVPQEFGELPVDEFLEHFRFVQSSDNWELSLEHLDRNDGVLVGQRDRLEAILTPMDVLSYLHEVASPFVMLAEIELSLRKIIELCVNPQELQACIHISLSRKYDEGKIPSRLSEMTFEDYVLILEHTRNWPHFSVAFGAGKGQRKRATGRLREVRALRNDVFHFRRELNPEDHSTLARHRRWLQMKARTFEARKAEKVAPEKPAPVRVEEKPKPSKKRTGKKWDETSFFAALEEGQSAAESAAARKIFEWVTGSTLFIRWGQGREMGSFSATFGDRRGPAVLRVWSNGWVTVAFLYLKALPPYDDEKMRLKLLRRLNTIREVNIDPSEIVKDASIRLSIFADAARLQKLLETIDWVVEEIEQAAAGGPEEPTDEDYVRVLTHIPVPRGQQQLYKALYDAGDDGLTHAELVKTMGRRDLQDLSGVLGALGHRISGIPGYGKAKRPGVEMVIAREQLADGQQRLRLVPEMRSALEELDPSWLLEMTP